MAGQLTGSSTKPKLAKNGQGRVVSLLATKKREVDLETLQGIRPGEEISAGLASEALGTTPTCFVRRARKMGIKPTGTPKRVLWPGIVAIRLADEMHPGWRDQT